MINIIDIIKHRNKYTHQWMMMVDRMPVFKYERVGDFLVGEDSGFFSFYKYQPPSRNFRAFAGREFNIPMVDGSVVEAHGQWWDDAPRDYNGLLYGLGASTEDHLAKFLVFCSARVDYKLIDDWVASNEPSNNIDKYNPRHKNYGKHTIVSQFEDAA